MKLKILIVENDPHILKLLSHVFSTNGFEICVAEDGHAFKKHCLAHKPDFIILDVVLGHQQDGVVIYKELLTEGLNPDTPVIFLSALAKGQIPDGLLQRPSRVFMGKPFDYKELLTTIRRMLPAA